MTNSELVRRLMRNGWRHYTQPSIHQGVIRVWMARVQSNLKRYDILRMELNVDGGSVLNHWLTRGHPLFPQSKTDHWFFQEI